jgi:hypothetical protein
MPIKAQAEPVWGEPELVLALSSGCVVEGEAVSAGEAVLDGEAALESGAAATASAMTEALGQEPVSEDFEEWDSLSGAASVPAPAKVDKLEERGMNDAGQQVAEAAEQVGTQTLGARIVNPFLRQPEPRAGSGKPRWTPVTVSLGAGEEAAEDWDIL